MTEIFLRPIKKLTKQRLKNITLSYLEKFGGTKKALETMLNKRIFKSCRIDIDNINENNYLPKTLLTHKKNATYNTQNMEQIKKDADEIIEWVEKLGYINDLNFANTQVQNLTKGGASKKIIALKLTNKGINPQDLKQALNCLTENSELEAAKTYAKKRKFGIYETEKMKLTNNQNHADKQERFADNQNHADKQNHADNHLLSDDEKMQLQNKKYNKQMSALARQGFSLSICKKVLGEI